MMSGFLFMAAVNGNFLLFFYNNQTHGARKAQSTRPQKQVP